MLFLNLTEDCNLSCITCRENVRIENHVMDRQLFERIVNETCYAVGCYSVFNWGESLLLPDFKQRIKYISKRKRQDARIALSTNGMLLSEDLCEFLADLDVETTVSFDASSKIHFEQIRRGSNFNKICKNIELLVSKYNEKESISVPGIYICIQKNHRTLLLTLLLCTLYCGSSPEQQHSEKTAVDTAKHIAAQQSHKRPENPFIKKESDWRAWKTDTATGHKFFL